MLPNLMTIVLFQLAGDFLQKLVGLPIPGPVLGMALLLLSLILRGRLPDELDRAASGLLSYLPMLFVPAGVGMMAHLDLVRTAWAGIAAGIVASSALAIVVTAGTMRGVERLQQGIRNRWLDGNHEAFAENQP